MSKNIFKMNLSDNPQNENITKIEDVIDIQKANGNFNVRQVAFKLPVETQSTTVSANMAKSLETGLAETKSDSCKKNLKKSRSKRHNSPLPDVISWPSDSDITVLRMQLYLTSDLKKKVGSIVPGDGLHHQDSSSMVNLATLMRQSQPPSKHSLSLEECLIPLTSWERQDQQADTKEPIIEHKESIDYLEQFKRKCDMYDAMCSHLDSEEKYSSKDSYLSLRSNKKSKMARFFRLYFCPCCTCLYKLEKMSDEPSDYFAKRKQL